ncbi:MAG: DUF4340 domain-containing protein [Eubacterium sp.]|nr:DUF4340 domain-containing protein [Eubacterium sp.]
MKKNAKILLASAAGIAVLGVTVTALVLTAPRPEEETSSTPDIHESVDLFNYAADDISKLTISNENGEFAINRLGMEKWGIDEIPEDYANTAVYSTVMKNAAELTALQKVEENSGDLGKYGLDKPTSEFSLDFKDGKYDSIKCIVGNKNEGAGGWYFKLGDSDTVYLVNENDILFSQGKYLDYMLLSGFIPSFDGDNDVVSRLRISRKDLDRDIVLDKLPDADPELENTNVYVGYEISSHHDVLADDEKDMGILYGLFELVASSAEAINPTAEQLAEYGLDDPYCSAGMVLNDEVVKIDIGNAIYAVNSETGAVTDEITGYYGKLQGRDVVYVFPIDKLPWVKITVDDILYTQFLTPYIYNIDTVTFANGEGESHTVKIVGNDSDTATFTLDGEKQLYGPDFRSFYRYLLSCHAEKIYVGELTEDNTLIGSFEYKYRRSHDGTQGDGVDTVELYSSEEDLTCIIAVNGQVRYKVRRVYGVRYQTNFEAILNGGNIQEEY